MIEMFMFKVTVKHDAGKTKITTAAQSIASVVSIIMASERCPERSILKIERLK